ncbi:hypothetical protein ACWCYY_26510 [Kitasatospora sp. NPDC001664]
MAAQFSADRSDISSALRQLASDFSALRSRLIGEIMDDPNEVHAWIDSDTKDFRAFCS